MSFTIQTIFGILTHHGGYILLDYMFRIEDEIRKELGENETKLWSAQPDPNRHFTMVDIFLIPFSLLWAGMVFFGLIDIILSGHILTPVLIMLIPFSVIGIYITVGRFIVKHMRKKKTIYVLTDKRAIEITGGRSRKVKSIYYSQINGINSSVNRSGAGKITFAQSNFMHDMYANSGMDFGTMKDNGYPRFYDLKDASKPLSIIKEQID